MSIGPYEGHSDTEVRAQVAAAQTELERRAKLPAAEQRARMTRELSEIESGERQAAIEHVTASDAATVARWTREGKLTHMGVAAPRRRR